jgi:hypothetical protein
MNQEQAVGLNTDSLFFGFCISALQKCFTNVTFRFVKSLAETHMANYIMIYEEIMI